MSPQDVIEILGVSQLGIIMRDNDIVVSANTGEPVVYNTKSRVGKSFLNLADRLIGANVPEEEFELSESLWARLGKRLRAA